MVKATYDTIGTTYDRTRKADAYITERLLYYLAPSKQGLYLDIGCGTGNYTDALQKKGYPFIGIDPSALMLAEAQNRNNQVDWRKGTAESTGLDTGSVDGIMGSMTLHHWTALKQGFIELNRVLKPKGNLVIFTATSEQMEGYWLHHYFPKMLEVSGRQMPSLGAIERAMSEAGFEISNQEPYFIQPQLQDLFLYSGKHHPDLYLDAQVRKGISSFASLANKEEVDAGLVQLATDIETGKVQEIIQSYENSGGDYLFVAASKSRSIGTED